MSRGILTRRARGATITLSLVGAAIGLSSCQDDIVAPASPAKPAAAIAQTTGYRLTLLQDPEGLSGAGINKAGKVAGTRGSCPFTCYPFTWTTASGFRNLSGFTAAGFAVDINNSSQVLIVTQTSGAHSFVWGRLTGIRELPSMGGSWTQGVVMNRYGDVAGQGSRLPPSGTSIRPAFWPASGGFVDIVPPLWQGSGSAMGLNNKGQVVGVLGIGRSTPLAGFPTPCHSCGFIWDQVNGLRRIPIASRRLSAAAINDVGQVVGYFFRDGAFHAFRWHSHTGVVELGTLGGDIALPYAINNLGVVVGSSRAVDNGEYHPFVWDEQRGMVDLGVPQGALSAQATDINLDGVITGEVVFPGPRLAMAIWTPQ